ncbi:FecR domain-containing protein [Pedobacter hartonius]|uniref:FecR family protein n=1 Tax=Pedobacter hartonius TaxID=425514 RepID=A0A1H4G8D4_9SPHI|nr:FecR domain-containing protein [Pedobacter hartonius]SEB05885.1 FecR family protein [Pedobacter hartonius]
MDKRFADFSAPTLEDFIDDPRFSLWVLHPDETLDVFWQQVQTDYPQTQTVIAEARQIILSLRFTRDEMLPEEQAALWQSIESAAKLRRKPVLTLSLWLRSAAAVLIAGLIGLSLFYYNAQQSLTVSTAYGKIRTLSLPDGSVVTLNANSVLRYPKKWNPEKLREVWIDGEAYFKISHLHCSGKIKEGERFIVHAQRLNVEVLGTSFDIHNRRGQVKVALLSGSIGLQVKGKDEPILRLVPGELAEYQEKKKTISKMRVQAGDYVAWKNAELLLNNTPLRDILLLIEDNYGYKAVLKDPSLGNRKLSGKFSFSSEDAFFRAIATSLGISILKDQSAHQLIIK